MSVPDCQYQDLSKFRVPKGFRGRSVVTVQLWWICQATLFAFSPRPAYKWRASLLRVFGAKIGRNSRIRSSARFTYPWKVSIGDNSWIGDRAELYSLVEISVGNNVCVSQDCYIATAGHDIGSLSFDYVTGPIAIEDEAWLASGAFVMPGVTVGRGAIVAARSVVTKDVAEALIVAGSPAHTMGRRHAPSEQ
ncbi:WcaF family extracellular polysaccharide biosynthesis acetyltransferase [Pseudoroseicyclus sp. H15]